MKSLFEESQIPSKYGGLTSSFKHIVCNYSFDEADLSTNSSNIQKPSCSLVYDAKKIQNIKNKIAFVEDSLEDLVTFFNF